MQEPKDSLGRRQFLKTGAAIVGASAIAGASPQTSPDTPQRGSEMLEEKLGEHGQTYSLEQMRQVIGTLRKSQGRIIDWCQYGQPAVDGFCGTVDVKVDLAGKLITELLGIRGLRPGVWVFPYGIPPVVDMARLRVSAGRFESR